MLKPWYIVVENLRNYYNSLTVKVKPVAEAIEKLESQAKLIESYTDYTNNLEAEVKTLRAQVKGYDADLEGQVRITDDLTKKLEVAEAAAMANYDMGIWWMRAYDGKKLRLAEENLDLKDTIKAKDDTINELCDRIDKAESLINTMNKSTEDYLTA